MPKFDVVRAEVSGVALEVPPRLIPIASISSMNPIAPPCLRAILRRCLKNERIRYAVMPCHIDWNAGAAMNRKGTPACFAMALARYVLPVPGGPFEQDAPTRRATQFVAEGGVAQEHVERTHDLVDLRVQPLDIGETGFDLLGIDRDVWRAPVEQRHGHHQQDRDQDQQWEEQDRPSRSAATAGSRGAHSSSGSTGRDRRARPRSSARMIRLNLVRSRWRNTSARPFCSSWESCNRAVVLACSSVGTRGLLSLGPGHRPYAGWTPGG